MIPKIDEDVKKAFDELEWDDIEGSECYPLRHELLWYGIKAVAHFHLMHMVGLTDEITPEFTEKYRLDLEETNPTHFHYTKIKHTGHGGFYVPLKAVEQDGIYFPKAAYYDGAGRIHERLVPLFEQDYINCILRDSWTDKEYATKFIGKVWAVGHLLWNNEKGIRFARDLWKTCVAGFEKYKDGHSDWKPEDPPQPQKITDLGRKLIAYYATYLASEDAK